MSSAHYLSYEYVFVPIAVHRRTDMRNSVVHSLGRRWLTTKLEDEPSDESGIVKSILTSQAESNISQVVGRVPMRAHLAMMLRREGS